MLGKGSKSLDELLMEREDLLYLLQDFKNNVRHTEEKIDKLNKELKESCPHLSISTERVWDGHRSESLYTCDTCKSSLLYHEFDHSTT